MTLLSVSGLTVHAGGTALVRDVSFSLAPGQRLGLIGESGSGKSLTSLAVLGLLGHGLHASGSVVLDGREVVGAPERALRALRGPVGQIVFQEPLTALDPLMPVGRQIAEPLRRHGVVREEVRGGSRGAGLRGAGLRGAELRSAVQDALAEVDLADPRIARAYPHELSGGQRQRVAIAIALAAHPQLLVADEPTTALDVTVQDGVLSLLEQLVADRGMALLFISHDLAVVARMTERIAVMRSGSIVETGDVHSVLQEPRHPYTQALVASARVLDDALDAGESRTESAR